jgi:hypothetical protein
MDTLVIVGIVLCVGWAGLWVWLIQQGRAQNALNEKLERLEK